MEPSSLRTLVERQGSVGGSVWGHTTGAARFRGALEEALTATQVDCTWGVSPHRLSGTTLLPRP